MRVIIEAVLLLLFGLSACACWFGVRARIESARGSWPWSPEDARWLRIFMVTVVLSASGLVMLLFPPPGG